MQKPLDEVIQALEHCTNNGLTCHECPYFDRTIGAECLDASRDDALYYLKEHQEKGRENGKEK